MKRLLSGLVAVVLLGLGLACDSVTPVAPADGVLTISVNPARIEANGEAIVTVLARKVDGFPVNPGTEINLATDVGLIETPVYTNDRGIAESVLSGNGDVGIATVTASSGSLDSAEITLQVGALPFDISLTATPAEISIREVPSGGYVIRLRATVIDDLGEVLQGIAVLFDTELGKLGSKGSVIRTNQKGVAKDTLTVNKNNLRDLSGDFFLVSASTGGDTDMDFSAEIISVDEEIAVVGFPSDLLLETSPSSIPATGGVVTLTATVRDEIGDPLEGVGVQFASQVGSSSSRGTIINTNINGQAFDTVSASQQDIEAFTPSSFTVEARVPDATVILTDTETINIQGRPPLAGFTFVSTGCLDVTFTNTTTPTATATSSPIEFEWNFGDGSPPVFTNLTATTVTHTFPSAGGWPVTLTATSAFGVDTVTQTVTVDPTPFPSFVVPTGTTAGSAASFNAAATIPDPPDLTNYAWNFGDPGSGSSNTGSGEIATHTYAADGTYTVTLTVTACSTNETASLSQLVTIDP